MNGDLIGRVAERLGDGDMGPGISLSAALKLDMAAFYPDDERGASHCVVWALRRAAERAIDELAVSDACQTALPIERKIPRD